MKPTLKVCPACGQSLSLGSFSRDASRPDGLDRLCRTCAGRARREQRQRRLAGTARPRGRPRQLGTAFFDDERLQPVRSIPNTPRVRMERVLDGMRQHYAEEAAR